MGEVSVGGVRLAYETRGAGPPVVIVSGTGQRAESWWAAVGATLVDAGYQVTVFDNRGIPPSDVPPPPYSVADMASDTIGVIEHLGAGPVALIGASLGALVTQTVSLSRPDLVRAAVFLAGCGNLSRYAAAGLSARVKALRAGIELNDAERAAEAMRMIAPSWAWGDDDAFEELTAVASAFLFDARDGELGQAEAGLGWTEADHVEELAGLRPPALAVTGGYDWAYPPALVRKAVARMPDGEVLELSHATHVSVESTATITAAVVDFLTRSVPVGGGPRT